MESVVAESDGTLVKLAVAEGDVVKGDLIAVINDLGYRPRPSPPAGLRAVAAVGEGPVRWSERPPGVVASPDRMIRVHAA